MERSEVFELLGAILEATRRGEIKWDETADEDTFRSMFRKGMVKVWRTEEGHPAAGIFNQNNTLLTEVAPESAEDSTCLEAVYEAARNSALKPGEVIKGILDEIKGKGRGRP
jgi:hypothetical protein